MNRRYDQAFTIVELLVVIVVIGILAAITVVSYGGITSRANVASIQSQLSSNSKPLKMYSVEYGSYPTALDVNNCPTAPTADTKYCIKNIQGGTLSYTGNASGYNLTISKGNVGYKTTESDKYVDAGTLVCPVGFIVVPGSATYGTSDFCVMKYEAKADDNSDGVGDTNQTTGVNTWPADTHPISATRKLVSTAAGYPVANISQTTAITAASSANFVYGCSSGCHIITEAEWMTIAQNVLSVPSNWSGGAVGTGYIYGGHNDSSPLTAIVADTSDANGYANTGNASGNQRRTLTLTNGEVIWDLAGDVWEWTTGQMTGGQPTGMAGWGWYQWAAVSGGAFAVNPYSSGTGISGSGSWTDVNGIGQIYGLTSDASLHGFRRSGRWDTGGNNVGVLTIALNSAPSDTSSGIGLRVSR